MTETPTPVEKADTTFSLDLLLSATKREWQQGTMRVMYAGIHAESGRAMARSVTVEEDLFVEGCTTLLGIEAIVQEVAERVRRQLYRLQGAREERQEWEAIQSEKLSRLADAMELSQAWNKESPS
jgi:hypothetical protein